MLVATGAETARDDAPGPKRDMTVLASALDASVVDRRDIGTSRIATLLRRFLGLGPAMAWLAHRRLASVDVVLTDGEHVGIPLALLLRLSRRRVKHVTIGHRLSSRKKRPFFSVLGAQRRIDRILLHSRAQERFALEDLAIPAERLALVPYQVDTDYWRATGESDDERLVASVGLEHRDYDTLVRAARGIDARFVIAAASHWSRHRFTGGDLPANVKVNQLDYAALRVLYQRAAIVVVPLHDVDNQAGVTTILEAMSMSRPVIVTQSRGQTDVVEDRRVWSRGRPRPISLARLLASERGLEVRANGFYVAPGNADELGAAIRYLLDRPELRARLGRAGRELVERVFTVDEFAARIRTVVSTLHADTHVPTTTALQVKGSDA